MPADTEVKTQVVVTLMPRDAFGLAHFVRTAHAAAKLAGRHVEITMTIDVGGPLKLEAAGVDTVVL